MFDHISISVHNLERSIEFYDAILLPLGSTRQFKSTRGAGWSPRSDLAEAPFAIVQVPEESRTGSTEMGHLAFRAPSRQAVISFFEAAVKQGAIVQSPPRVVTEYGPHYFAAFIEDPDGYNLEAVCHQPDHSDRG